MLQAVTHFYSVPAFLLVKKHEIVNNIKSRITRAFIKVSTNINKK